MCARLACSGRLLALGVCASSAPACPPPGPALPLRPPQLLKRRELIKAGDLVVVLSDLREPQQPSIDAIRSVQVGREGGLS